MEQAGLMERLFTSVQLMLSRTREALYLAVLFVSTIRRCHRHRWRVGDHSRHHGGEDDEPVGL